MDEIIILSVPLLCNGTTIPPFRFMLLTMECSSCVKPYCVLWKWFSVWKWFYFVNLLYFFDLGVFPLLIRTRENSLASLDLIFIVEIPFYGIWISCSVLMKVFYRLLRETLAPYICLIWYFGCLQRRNVMAQPFPI